MRVKPLLLIILLAAAPAPLASPAWAGDVHIDIVHRDGPRRPPPAPREERFGPRRGFVWEAGHHEWRHGRYVWRAGHYRRERRGFDWDNGRWDKHDDHYDWRPGQWHPRR